MTGVGLEAERRWTRRDAEVYQEMETRITDAPATVPPPKALPDVLATLGPVVDDIDAPRRSRPRA